MNHFSSAFITGAGGFIGRHLVERLLKNNVTITALMMEGEAIPSLWNNKVNIVTGDVRHLLRMKDNLQPCDVIFHLAAVVGDWGAQQDHIDVTVNGTEQAIELALLWQSHFIVTTSVCAYASQLAKGKLNEQSLLGTPSSPYEFCKQEQERVTKNGVKKGLKASIIRPANVFGVGSGPWVNTLLDMMRNSKPCMIGTGEWDAGLVHVNNLISILIAVANSTHTNGDIYLAADGFGVTWKEYMTRLALVADVPPPKNIPLPLARILAPTLEFIGHITQQKTRPLITRQSFRLMGGANEFSIKKAQKELDYSPFITFDQAMNELKNHFSKQK